MNFLSNNFKSGLYKNLKLQISKFSFKNLVNRSLSVRFTEYNHSDSMGPFMDK